MQVQLIIAGNFLPLTLSVLPTGEKQRTTFNCFLTLSMKNFQQFSLVSGIPAPYKSIVMLIWSSGTCLKVTYLDLIPDCSNNILHVIISKQVRNLTRCQKIINQNQKSFISNLGITH